MNRLSSRFHLAMGLASLVVTVLLAALFGGLLPDRDGALRAARTSLAESVAVAAAALVSDDEDDTRLSDMLAYIVSRNPELRAITLRTLDGTPRLQAGTPGPESAAAASNDGHSTETLLRVPLAREGQTFGRVDLEFAPLQGDASLATLLHHPLVTVGLISSVCFVLFYLYLRRMLKHLDPARVVPGRVRTAFDTLAEGLMVLDPAGRIVLANLAFAEVLGQTPEALIGRAATALDWVADPANASAESGATLGAETGTDLAALLQRGQAWRNALLVLRCADGQQRSFMVNGSPVPGAGGKAAGVLVSFDDVTELQAQEIALRIARDQAEAANQAKSDFLANMSHEIRTPMNAVLGFAQLLRRNPQLNAGNAQRHLDTILGSGRHLLTLINDILDLSKVEAGRMEVERIDCALHQVVHEVATVMRVRADEKGVALLLDFPEPLPAQVRTDPARLTQVITNLVGNALKFTERGQVTLRVYMKRADDGRALVAIDISDTGIGIPADKVDAIFEPFVQAEVSTTRRFGGTGLGLAISRRFARALGGDVYATSVLGQGSTFHITIDAGLDGDVQWLEPAQLAEPPRRAAAVSGQQWHFAPATVLVVDDGAENRELVRLVIEPTGLRVVEAENGQQAIDQVAAERPAIVLMDVQMPVMDGYTAARKLREDGCTLPILALTANAMKGFERELESAGFSGYVSKPVDIDLLLAELGQRLGGTQQPTAAAAAVVAAAAPVCAAAAAEPAARLPNTEPDAPTAAAAAVGDAAVLPKIVSRLAAHPRLAKVARNFALTLPDKLAQMRRALAAGQFDELAELAHWLKGAGGTVGYDAFFEPARDFEQHVKAGQRAAMADGLAVLEALAARIEAPPATPSAAAGPATAATVAATPTLAAAPPPSVAAAATPALAPTTPPAAAGLPTIVSRLAGHPRLAKVARNFALALPDKLAQMQRAFDSGQWDELAALAHWLKGAGGTVGYDAFFEPARDFEQHITSGQRAGMAAGLAALQALAARVEPPAAAEAGVASAAEPAASALAPPTQPEPVA